MAPKARLLSGGGAPCYTEIDQPCIITSLEMCDALFTKFKELEIFSLKFVDLNNFPG